MIAGRTCLIKVFCPSEMAGSVFDIDLDGLSRRGIKALIVDLDNTLVGWDSDEISPRVCQWIKSARSQGFGVCIASNGLDTRVRKVATLLDIPAIAKATKPRKRPFRQALEILGVRPEEVAVVGDQVFTDIFGGNRMELYTILINPISPKELPTTQMVRHVERRLLTRLHKKGLLHKRALEVRQHGCSDK
jgi:HAD superfamily phosphatase (TIGR01668 family)